MRLASLGDVFSFTEPRKTELFAKRLEVMKTMHLGLPNKFNM